MLTTATDWSPKLDALGLLAEGIADIDQCIGIILTTPLGSDPHRPQFGCDLWRYLDRPASDAVPYIVRDVTEALRLWEKRIEVLRVSPTPSGIDAAHWTVSVIWRLVGDVAQRQTEVRP
jgi:uncharacterized protein